MAAQRWEPSPASPAEVASTWQIGLAPRRPPTHKVTARGPRSVVTGAPRTLMTREAPGGSSHSGDGRSTTRAAVPRSTDPGGTVRRGARGPSVPRFSAPVHSLLSAAPRGRPPGPSLTEGTRPRRAGLVQVAQAGPSLARLPSWAAPEAGAGAGGRSWSRWFPAWRGDQLRQRRGGRRGLGSGGPRSRVGGWACSGESRGPGLRLGPLWPCRRAVPRVSTQDVGQEATWLGLAGLRRGTGRPGRAGPCALTLPGFCVPAAPRDGGPALREKMSYGSIAGSGRLGSRGPFGGPSRQGYQPLGNESGRPRGHGRGAAAGRSLLCQVASVAFVPLDAAARDRAGAVPAGWVGTCAQHPPSAPACVSTAVWRCGPGPVSPS